MIRTAVFRCVVAAVLFGASAAAASKLAGEVNASTLGGLLYAGAALAVLPVTVRRPPTLQSLRRGGSRLAVAFVVGIVITAGEHRTRTATDTYLTTPRRDRVLTAKLAVCVALGAGIGIITAGVAAAIAAALYVTQDADLPVGGGDVWLTLGGTIVYTALFAALGIAIGALIRNQTAAVAGALVWFAVVEQILINLVADVGKWLPGGAGQAIIRSPVDDLLSPAAGVAVLAAYAMTIAAAGVIAERRRDA